MAAVFIVVVGDRCSSEVEWQLFSVWWWGRDVPQRWDDSCFQCGGGGGMFLRGGMAASFSVVVGGELFLRGGMIAVFSVVVGDGCSSEVRWQMFSVWWWGMDVPQRWDDSCFQCGGGGWMFLRGGMADVFSVVVGDGCSSEVG